MISAHGGLLINKIASDKEINSLKDKAKTLTRIDIAYRNSTDCEMIANGCFSPLEGFMSKYDAESVINKTQLADGTLWAIPIVLPVRKEISSTLNVGQEIALYDEENTLIAIMKVADKYTLDLNNYCEKVFKTTDTSHPGVKVVMDGGNSFIGGEITLINRPVRENIGNEYYRDPQTTREYFKKQGWKTVVAFQTRNPIHRAHEYIIKTAMEPFDGIMIHPLVGETKSDDIPANTRMECYEVLIDNYFNKDRTFLSVLPTTMRYAGPKEALHHMIMRKNYGCTHMIVGRDHAGVGNYYGTYEAQEMVDKYADKLGIQAIKLEHSFYCTKCENMASQKTCPHTKESHVFLSGTKVREMLQNGQRPPKEFSRAEVADILIKWATKDKEKELV